MADLEQLRIEYEQADAEATRLSGEYSQRYEQGVRELREQLQAEYGDQIEQANQQARDLQQAYADHEAAYALLERGDAEQVLGDMDRLTGGAESEGTRRLRETYQALAAERG